MANGRMRVSRLLHSTLINEKSRVSALDQKSVRTIDRPYQGLSYCDEGDLLGRGSSVKVLKTDLKGRIQGLGEEKRVAPRE